MNDRKCVIVVDENLPIGIIANTAAILGITLGARLPDVVGEDVRDGQERSHMGIIEFPVPILKASAEMLGKLRLSLYDKEYADLTIADFTDIAQSCVILIYNLRIDIFAAISRLSLRQRSLAYIQYACVAFPCARRDLAANLVYTTIAN